MARYIKIGITPKISRYLQQLAILGVFGRTPTEVAQFFVWHGLIEAMERGHIKVPRRKKKRKTKK